MTDGLQKAGKFQKKRVFLKISRLFFVFSLD